MKMSNHYNFINWAKISIIVLVSIFLVGFFFPFYEYPNDSRVYGFQSILMSGGQYEYANDMLESTGKWEFVPNGLIKTHDNKAIPNILPLFPLIGSSAFKFFGTYGLFFLGPFFAIISLILTERIATRFFGRYVGFLTLIFFATNEMLFWVGRSLLTSTLFSVLFLAGVFFLVDFFKERKDSSILIASVFFTLTAFVRPNGVILVPIEIGVIILIFVFRRYFSKNQKKFVEIRKNNLTKSMKIAFFTIGPWMCFILFMLSFNIHYFDDPLVTIYNVPGAPQHFIADTDSNALMINGERIENYAEGFLPYPINRISDAINSDVETEDSPVFSSLIGFVENNQNPILLHLGILTFLVIILSIVVALKKKNYVIQCVISSIFIVTMILFYSTNFIAVGRQGSARDMLPVFPLFYMLLSFLIISLLTTNVKKLQWSKLKIILKSSKIFVVIALLIFIPFSFYFADYSQIIKKEGFTFKDPKIFAENFPVYSDPINEDDIVLTLFKWDQTIYHGSIPFTPLGLERNFNPENPLYLNMLDTLKNILINGKNVYVFKDPGLEREKDFHNELVKNGDFVLKQYSTNFCKLELSLEKNAITDEECLK